MPLDVEIVEFDTATTDVLTLPSASADSMYADRVIAAGKVFSHGMLRAGQGYRVGQVFHENLFDNMGPDAISMPSATIDII